MTPTMVYFCLRASYAGQAGIVFGSVCVRIYIVCLSAQNLENYWPVIDVTW